MIKKIIDKRNYLILFIIVILLVWILFFNKKEIYVKSFNYFDKVITFKIYDNVNHKQVTNDINNIYKKYENYDFKGKLTDDEKALIEYGKILYFKTDGYIDITTGELIENLKNNRNYEFKTDIEKIEIKDGKLTRNISFNFDNVLSCYATNDVLYYFKQNDITKYIVNEDGDITAGKHYQSGKYDISISNPNNDKVLKIVSFENKSMITRNYVPEIKSYMINPKNSKVEHKYDSVVVIAKDNLTASMLADSLYLMDMEDGKKLLSDYNGEALWITGDDFVMTDGFNKYIKK